MATTLPIDEIVRFGRVFNPRLAMVDRDDDTRSAVVALFNALETAELDYMLVGGVALLSYVEGRNTQDVDLIVDPSALERVDWSANRRDRDFAEASFRGIHVDLLLTDNPLFADVRRTRRTTVQFGALRVPCATREGLVLLKLYALPSLYRQGKLARAALYETDILMLHQGAAIDDELLLRELAPHVAPSDVGELGRILAEQRQRRRF